jgi:hypothetical protein
VQTRQLAKGLVDRTAEVFCEREVGGLFGRSGRVTGYWRIKAMQAAAGVVETRRGRYGMRAGRQGMRNPRGSKGGI